MSQMLKAKAVIFDRDGVIINTEGIAIDSVRKAFKQIGFDLQDEDIPHIIGRSSRVYKDYFLEKWDFNFDKYLELQRNIFYSNLDKAEYFQSAIDLIKSLHTNNIPLGVTTSASRDGTLLILNKIGVDQMFKVIVTKEDCEKLKPDPEPYVITSTKLEIEPQFCVAIEDTALGVEAAKKAGMMCIAIPNEYTKDQDFSMADIVLESASEVEGILEFI